MKFKAYRDNIFCMTLRSVFGVINGLLCPDGEEGWGGGKGMGVYYTVWVFFFFSLHWGKLQIIKHGTTMCSICEL